MIKAIKKNIKDCDKTLLILSISMFIIGLLNIVTASSREAVVRYQESLYYYFFKQAKMISIGIALSIFFISAHTKIYKTFAKIGFIIISGFCVYLLICGTSIKGAANWIYIPIINVSFQPSEFAKIIIIVTLAIIFEKYSYVFQSKEPKRFKKIAIILIVGLFIPAVVFLQKDFGTMFIMCVIFLVLFISSPILKSDKIKTIIFSIVVLILFFVGLYLKNGYVFTKTQLKRFDYFEPCSKYETTGYQICNSYIAINNGGLFGLGLSKSKQIYSYIPEPHTDSVFAIIFEETGLLGCMIVFSIYVVIIWRIIKIACNSSTLRGRYICLGVATYIFMHIFINLGGLSGMIPLTGVPLPFLSYGGSFAISLMCSIALVQRVNIETKNKKIKV